MTDRRTVFAVVLALAVIAAGALGGVVLLATLEKPIPDLLGYVLTTGLGALAALLASTKSEPMPVTGTEDAVPVPVVEQAAGKRTRAARKDAGQVDMMLLVFAVNAATLVLVCLIAHKVGVW